jgi:hypothetical protein
VWAWVADHDLDCACRFQLYHHHGNADQHLHRMRGAH